MREAYAIVLAFGAILLLAAVLPALTRRTVLSTPIIAVAFGYGAFALGLAPAELVRDARGTVLEPMLEAVLLFSIMGAGLSIDRRVSLSDWSTAWRLLAIGMPLMAIATAATTRFVLGLTLPEATLLAAMIMPTDPVLARAIGVGPPGTGRQDEVRFGITSEAGMNDGLAYPVALLGIELASKGSIGLGDVAADLVWGVAASVAAGWVSGRAAGLLAFRSKWWHSSDLSAGLLATGTAMLGYGLGQVIGGYGFISVFVAALNLRAVCPHVQIHKAMNRFSSALEQILLMAILLLFGGFLASGVMADLTWPIALLALAFIAVLRPITAFVSLLGSRGSLLSRSMAAFFGTRGMGTLYYAVFIEQRTTLPHLADIRILVAFTVLCSIVVHGASSTPLNRLLEDEPA